MRGEGAVHPTSNGGGLIFYALDTKVPVFYCLMKKFNSQNFYQNFFSLILTNLDQTHRDLLKITTKIFW